MCISHAPDRLVILLSLLMNDIFSHRASVIVGGDAAHTQLLEILTKSRTIKIQGNPDFFDRRYAAFSIDDAREVKSAHEMRPTTEEGKKIFLLTMDGITVEAQNALLKLLEEPASYAYFYIVIPSVGLLLPTVVSRVAVISLDAHAVGSRVVAQTDIQSDIAADAKQFLKLSPAKRLDFIKKFTEDISKEKRPKHDAVKMLAELQHLVRSAQGPAKGHDALKALSLAHDYANDRAPSLKMLLEYVALSI